MKYIFLVYSNIITWSIHTEVLCHEEYILLSGNIITLSVQTEVKCGVKYAFLLFRSIATWNIVSHMYEPIFIIYILLMFAGDKPYIYFIFFLYICVSLYTWPTQKKCIHLMMCLLIVQLKQQHKIDKGNNVFHTMTPCNDYYEHNTYLTF